MNLLGGVEKGNELNETRLGKIKEIELNRKGLIIEISKNPGQAVLCHYQGKPQKETAERRPHLSDARLARSKGKQEQFKYSERFEYRGSQGKKPGFRAQKRCHTKKPMPPASRKWGGWESVANGKLQDLEGEKHDATAKQKLSAGKNQNFEGGTN